MPPTSVHRLISLCKAIVENAMGGKIWLESTLGVGTTVSFSVSFKKVMPADIGSTAREFREPDLTPRLSPDNSTPAEPKPAGSVTNLSSISRERIRVCIAEDNPINQKIAVSFVKKIGFKCEAFSDGQKAVEALEKASLEGNPFHLVLMDCQMPVCDGYEATRRIRSSSVPDVRSILIIAMTASLEAEKCLEAGMNNYLAKPVKAQTLKKLLEQYLAQPPKAIPNLQQEAETLVKDVVEEAVREEDGDGKADARPSPTRILTAQRRRSGAEQSLAASKGGQA